MEMQLTQGLTFLAWSSAIFIIVVGIFLAKLLIDLSRLTLNLNKSAKIIGVEMEPIMKNVSETVSTLNRIVQDTDKKVNKFTKLYDKVSEIALTAVEKASVASGVIFKGLFKGACSIFKSMLKK